MRLRSTIVVAAAVVLAVVTVPSVAVAADEPSPCFTDLRFVIEGGTPGSDPVITGGTTARTKVLHVDRGACTNAHITLTGPNGATRTAVLDQVEAGPRYWGEFAYVDLPQGQWRVSEYSVDGATTSGGIAPPFRVRYGSEVTADPIATVTAPARSVISGTVRSFAGGAAAVPEAGRRVEVYSHLLRNPLLPFSLSASGYTDAQGRYRISVPFTVNSVVDVVAPDSDRSARADAESLAAHVVMTFRVDSQPSAWPAKTWVKVTGRTTPAVRAVQMTATTAAGNQTGAISYKKSNADGTFALYFPPYPAGGYLLTAGLSPAANNPDNDGAGVTRTWAIALYRATHLTGTAGATSGSVIRPGTRMSTYGHLSITEGTTKPYAGRKVLVQTRPHNQTTAPFTTVASATTTSTGYYYTNWTARTDVDVRVAYVSTDRYTTSAYRVVRFVDVR
jgi:hypothetical protein